MREIDDLPTIVLLCIIVNTEFGTGWSQEPIA